MSDTLDFTPPNSAPASPAMNAERQNTASLVRRTSRPRVAQAAWLSRMAAKPPAERARASSASTPTPTAANTTAQRTRNALVAGEGDAEQVEAADLDAARRRRGARSWISSCAGHAAKPKVTRAR